MILSYQTLLNRHKELIPLEKDRDVALINPASIDIRVGYSVMNVNAVLWDISDKTKEEPFWMEKGEFFLVETLETMAVPIDLVMEMKLKSSRAREGYNHSLAFWFDPGWYGVGTMELTSLAQRVPLYPGLRIAQIIYHKLDEPCIKPYVGKYQNAIGVETAK